MIPLNYWIWQWTCRKSPTWKYLLNWHLCFWMMLLFFQNLPSEMHCLRTMLLVSQSNICVLCDQLSWLVPSVCTWKHVIEKFSSLVEASKPFVCHFWLSPQVLPTHVRAINPQSLTKCNAVALVHFYGHRGENNLFPYLLIHLEPTVPVGLLGDWTKCLQIISGFTWHRTLP